MAETPFNNGLFSSIQYEAKGHFYLQEHEGRTLFITPDGKGFYPIGINHLNVPVNKGVEGRNHTDVENDLISHMKDWGFNCGGYGTHAKLVDKGFYFIGTINFALQGFYHMEKVEFPDVFSDTFAEDPQKRFADTAERNYKPDRLIGMVWTDLPSWNLHKSRMLRKTDWVSQIRLLDKEAAGKKEYLKFLQTRYSDKEVLLKKYYNLSDDELNSLEDHDFSKLFIGHPAIIEDDELFMVKIAERYYALGANLHDKYFKNVPLLGDRYLLNDHPDDILKIAAKYVDAISIQIGDGYGEAKPPSYPYPKDIYDHIHALTGKPLLVADHQISFYTNDYTETTFSQAGSEADASLETMKFLKETYSEPYVCGYFRCTYLSQGEPFGRGIKQGLVDFKQKPYELMTKAYKSLNMEIDKFVKSQQ